MRNSLFLLGWLAASWSHAQHPVIENVLASLSIDSMLLYVNELTGELPVDVGNGPELIVSRHKNNDGNAVAQAYLEMKLAGWGYTPQVQSFSVTGKNVYAIKEGTVYPNEYVILCAHYDALPAGFLAAPAADDDGSGCGALLEAARILRDIDFEYSIIFGLWDEEEQGLVGSAFYAGGMAANDAVIRGVVNMDAIAWDGNADTKARVHTRPIANSFALADSTFAVLERYNIDIDLLLTNPGATYSDHASFWNNGYGAILIIEEFGADGNPHYHTSNDRVMYFDVPYFEKLAKLSIGTLATIAVPAGIAQSTVERSPLVATGLYAFPNPSSALTSVWLETPVAQRYRIELLDGTGRIAQQVYQGEMPAGKNTLSVDLASLPAGAYLLRAIPAQGEAVSLRLVRTP